MKISMIHFLAVLFVAACSVCSAQTRMPVRMLAGFPPGGNVDILARLLGEKLSESLDRPVVVENRPGAGGQIALELVKAAAPDGNTLVLTPDASIVLRPLTMKNPPYDPRTDFAPVAHTGGQDYVFAVGANIPAKDLREFANWAKANPGGANFGSAGQGGVTHFLGLLIGEAIGVPLRQVPYKGSGPAVTALVAGEVSATVQPIGTVVAQAQAGRIRILASSGSARYPAFPNVPTLAEYGYPSLTASSWFGIFAPARTPPEIVSRMNDIFIRAMRTQAVKDKMQNLLLDVRELTPAQFASVVNADYQRWVPVIKASGFSGESQ